METTQNINHIVLSGGGVYAFIAYGILKESNISKAWNLENIKSIYGTSAGAIMGLTILLGFEWDVLDKYILNRPWQQVFHFDMTSIFNSFYKKGILNINVINKMFEPLFKAKDLHMDITMKELFENTGIDFHLFTTKLNGTEPIELSYETHPDWKVLEALYASCCLPILFSPFEKDGDIYFDGGMYNNYPIVECINKYNCQPNEVLGINRVIPLNHKLTDENTLFDYLSIIMTSLISKTQNKQKYNKQQQREVSVNIADDYTSPYVIYLVMSTSEERLKLINMGIDIWNKYSSVENTQTENSNS